MPSVTRTGDVKTGESKAAPSPARKRRGLFGWFFRGRAAGQPVRIDASNKASQTPAANGPSGGSVSSPVAPAPVAAPPAERRKTSEKAIDRLEKGYQEVTELVHALRQHIDRQADRSERLLEKMEHLPEALASLPKVSETNHQLLNTMQMHLEQQQEHSQRLTQVIDGLVHASKHRDDAIDMLRQQFEATREKDVHLMNGFATLGENMSKICDFQQKTASVLDRVMQMGAAAEQRMRDMLDVNKRNARTLAMSGWALVVVSLAMTAFVAIAATRLASYPAAPAAAQSVIERPMQTTPQPTQAAAEVEIDSVSTASPASPATLVEQTPTMTEAQWISQLGAIELNIDWASLADRASQASRWLAPRLTPQSAAQVTPEQVEGPAAVSKVVPVEDAVEPDPAIERVVSGGSE